MIDKFSTGAAGLATGVPTTPVAAQSADGGRLAQPIGGNPHAPLSSSPACAAWGLVGGRPPINTVYTLGRALLGGR